MWLVRSTKRYTQPFCKVEFTKITFFAFFSQKICTYQKKAVLLHRNSQVSYKQY